MKSSLKWPGGKGRLATWIVSLMPEEYTHYVECYAGGLSVLFANDPEGVSEVVNDLDGELMNFWRVLRSETRFPKFLRCAEATEFGQRVYEDAASGIKLDDSLDGDWREAWRFFVRCRQSLAARMDQFTSVTKTRTRRGMNNEVSAWLSAVEGLPQVHARLKRVLILNRDALEVIRGQDSSHTLFYLDPPYLPETRASLDVYECETTVEHHGKLLEMLTGIQGKFMLSGYHSEMYNTWAGEHGFVCHEKEVPNNAAHGKVKRRMVECVWCNY